MTSSIVALEYNSGPHHGSGPVVYIKFVSVNYFQGSLRMAGFSVFYQFNDTLNLFRETIYQYSSNSYAHNMMGSCCFTLRW